MKKKLLVFFLPLFISGCSVLSLINNEKVELQSGVASIPKDSLMIVKVSIDEHKSVPMLFDTGSSITFLTNDAVFDYNIKRKIVKFGNAVTIDGEKYQNTLAPVNLQTPWFSSPNKVIGLLPSPKNPCATSVSVFGLLGIDAFLGKNVVLDMNFDNAELATILASNISQSRFAGYLQIKATFDKKRIYIHPVILGQERKLLLDTGNSGGIMLPLDIENILIDSAVILEGKGLKSAVESFASTTYFVPNIEVIFGSGSEQYIITMLEGHEINNAGLTFIRRFNWLIDFGKQEIWIQRNRIQDETNSSISLHNKYFTAIENGLLRISSKIRGNNQFQLNDIITSIDGIPVTSDNICDMQTKLTIEKWENLKIEVQK